MHALLSAEPRQRVEHYLLLGAQEFLAVCPDLRSRAGALGCDDARFEAALETADKIIGGVAGEQLVRSCQGDMLNYLTRLGAKRVAHQARAWSEYCAAAPFSPTFDRSVGWARVAADADEYLESSNFPPGALTGVTSPKPANPAPVAAAAPSRRREPGTQRPTSPRVALVDRWRLRRSRFRSNQVTAASLLDDQEERLNEG